jgi:hypothetical protein
VCFKVRIRLEKFGRSGIGGDRGGGGLVHWERFQARHGYLEYLRLKRRPAAVMGGDHVRYSGTSGLAIH